MLKSKIINLSPLNDGDTVYNQTVDLFEQASIYFKNIVRIWIELNNIDENYLEFSEARNSVFKKHGYHIGDRTFVSTCIGIKESTKLKLLVIPNINQEQISFIDLPHYLPHTNTYNVSFERGSKVEFKNGTHYYISGTASIDKHGEILYKGDVVKQTKRSLMIIKKLLNKNNINMDEIFYLKWYIRNESDIEIVKKIINNLTCLNKQVDIYFQHAEICRKEWLVEGECFALSRVGNNRFEDFSYGL